LAEKQWPIAKPVKKIELKNRPVPPPTEDSDSEFRLNKFVAHCGLAARRKAAEMVKNGQIFVNGKPETNPAYIVQPRDKVSFEGKLLQPETRKVYILMNKPKDAITTLEDERDRRTVMDIVGKSVSERIFPVGRLDRDTTGLLLLTNDGDLAQKMAHPSFKVQKIYTAGLNHPLADQDLEKIRRGVELEDGLATVNWIRTVEGSGKREVELEIVIGKNRVVRRIFEHLGYEVEKLDRVYYAGLTKKDLPRGRFRFLTEREIVMLKHFQGRGN
jgi:23S rRNA pseudouridine2605 synthase